MPTSRTVNKRGQGARLGAEILAAATRLLGEASSRDAVTLRAIAREAGIAAPSVYKHFDDRDAILDTVVSDTFLVLEEVCRNAVATKTTGIDRVRVISHAYVEFAAEHRSEYRILFERPSTPGTTEPRLYLNGTRAFQYFSDAFAQMIAEGTSHSLDPVRDAQALWAALHGVVTLIPATPAFPWSPPKDIVEHLIDRLAGSAATTSRSKTTARKEKP